MCLKSNSAPVVTGIKKLAQERLEDVVLIRRFEDLLNNNATADKFYAARRLGPAEKEKGRSKRTSAKSEYAHTRTKRGSFRGIRSRKRRNKKFLLYIRAKMKSQKPVHRKKVATIKKEMKKRKKIFTASQTRGPWLLPVAGTSQWLISESALSPVEVADPLLPTTSQGHAAAEANGASEGKTQLSIPWLQLSPPELPTPPPSLVKSEVIPLDLEEALEEPWEPNTPKPFLTLNEASKHFVQNFLTKAVVLSIDRTSLIRKICPRSLCPGEVEELQVGEYFKCNKCNETFTAFSHRFKADSITLDDNTGLLQVRANNGMTSVLLGISADQFCAMTTKRQDKKLASVVGKAYMIELYASTTTLASCKYVIADINPI